MPPTMLATPIFAVSPIVHLATAILSIITPYSSSSSHYKGSFYREYHRLTSLSANLSAPDTRPLVSSDEGISDASRRDMILGVGDGGGVGDSCCSISSLAFSQLVTSEELSTSMS